MLADILKEVRFALNDKGVRKKQCIEVAFWCHGGKQRSVAAARIAEYVLKFHFGKRITVPPTKHMMRSWWIRIPCQIQSRKDRSLLACITLFVFNVHVSCSC
jgi:hypothetical protein